MYGLDPKSLNDPIDWSIWRDESWPMGSREEYMKCHEFAVTEFEGGILRTMGEIPGASDALWEIHEAGVRIHVATARLVPTMSNAKTIEDTVSWLSQPRADGRVRVPYDDISFVAKKHVIQADVHIEDSLRQLEPVVAEGQPAILFAASYNTMGLKGAQRAEDWPQAAEMILQIHKKRQA